MPNNQKNLITFFTCMSLLHSQTICAASVAESSVSLSLAKAIMDVTKATALNPSSKPMPRTVASNVVDFAKLANAAYHPGDGAPSGYLEMSKLRVDKPSTGFSASTFTSADCSSASCKRVVIAFKGSDNILAVLNVSTGDGRARYSAEQVQDALGYYQTIKNQYPGAEIIVTGHSLGAQLAAMVSIKEGVEGYGFNSIGVPVDSLTINQVVRFTNVVEKGEIAKLDNFIDGRAYVGNVYSVDFMGTQNAGAQHDIGRMVASIENVAWINSLNSMPFDLVAAKNMFASPVTNVNNNVGTSGANTTIASIVTKYSGTIAYSTSLVSYETNTARGSDVWTISQGKMTSWDFRSLGQSGVGALGSATNEVSGPIKLSDGTNAYWGRWVGGTQITFQSNQSAKDKTVFYAYGVSTKALPLNTTLTYQPAALGSPFGIGTQSGTFKGGTITVNTGTQSISVNRLTFGYDSGSVFAGSTFVMNGAGTYQESLRFSGNLNGTCSGGFCGSSGVEAIGSFRGRFIGKNGEGIALAYGAVTKNSNPALAAIGIGGYLSGTGSTVFKIGK